MMRVRLCVAYDGTNYCGWQLQPNGITIEEVLNRELTRLLKEEIHVIGASRTDAGVHSLGNIAVFDTESRMPAEKISYALNASLPKDIVIQKSEEVRPDWHPRYQKGRKTYEYRILNCRFPKPLERWNSYFYHYPLDVEKMRQGAAFLVGEHDFTSFSSIHAQVKTFTRTIYSLEILKEKDILTIRVTGNGFLYNMVRIIAGTLLMVGNGKIQPDEVKQILEGKNRNLAGPTAPPMGLTMIGIVYDDEKPES